MTDTELAAATDAPPAPEAVLYPTDTAPAPVPEGRPAPAAAERPVFVYALGRIEPRFPSLGVEKEVAQVLARMETAGLTDRQAMKALLEDPDNRYLARSLCWVFLIEGMETYIVVPRDPNDLHLLVESYREEARRDDIDVVVGVRGPLAPPDMCNGLTVPIVVFDQIYSFDRDYLLKSIPLPHGLPAARAAQFRSTAGGVLEQFRQLADNAGATDEHRALNYLLLRYPDLYAKATEQYDRNFAFQGVDVRTSALSGVRSVVDVVLSFRNRDSDLLEQQSVRVDVTEEFPFLANPIGPFFGR
jgi:hypothetical protein